jgi:ornithine decarboxylase
VVGPTCDSFDKISLSEQLPANLQIGDYLYTENIGAYSIASATKFNGFDGAKILHLNKSPVHHANVKNVEVPEKVTNDGRLP